MVQNQVAFAGASDGFHAAIIHRNHETGDPLIFKRKKPEITQSSGQHVMRGRGSPENTHHSGSADPDNPLARRFHPDDEPDTIDLQQTSRFNAGQSGEEADPATRDLSAAPGESFNIISYVPETGKFYLHPGEDSHPVLLGDRPIDAPTELRYGDHIRIADTEFIFSQSSEETGKQ
jgi:hypothetical protein